LLFLILLIISASVFLPSQNMH